MSLTYVITQYSLHRAVTGRLASGFDDTDLDKQSRTKREQVQNVPKKLRDTIVPEPGYYFIGGDWRAIQWALCMYEAAKVNEPAGYHQGLLDKFDAGELDPHTFLASHFDPTKQGRQRAKSYTYGRMFKGSARTLAREAGHRDNLGIEICNAHDEAFKLQAWWDHVEANVKRKRHIQTDGGWRCWFWDYNPDLSDVLAALIQASEADVLKATFPAIYQEARVLGGRVITTTHDSVLVMIPHEVEDSESKTWLKNKMEAPIDFMGGRQWKAEVESGMSWREVS